MVTVSPIVVIPTYNERDNIRPLVTAVRQALPGSHLLFVDDASPDGTAEEVESVASQHPGEIHLLRRPGKQGLGTAYKAGFASALSQPYTHLLQMDADLSHNPADLPRLLEAVTSGKGDFAVGSRYVPGGDNEFTFQRKLVSRGGSLYARAVLGMPVRDLTGGFKCWRRDVLVGLDLGSVQSQGYAFQIETTYRAVKKGFRVVEVPIHFGPRAAGVSKMSGRILLEALLLLWRLRWKVR
jgi:dolichol-phosphate mannosyltransferase